MGVSINEQAHLYRPNEKHCLGFRKRHHDLPFPNNNRRPEWNDIFEARTPGRVLKNPGFINSGFWASSDRRKKFYMSAFGFAANTFEKGRNYYEIGAGPNWVVNSKLLLQADISYNQSNHEIGWVNNLDNDIIIGQRNRSTSINLSTTHYARNCG